MFFSEGNCGNVKCRVLGHGCQGEEPSIFTQRTINIAILGDSITEGWGLEDGFDYPNQLQNRVLHENVKIYNFGVSGRTMTQSVQDSYWKMDQFIEALELRADFYVVMLGTNDAKTQIFDENEFLNSYSEMLKILKSIVDLKNIYVMIPPPVTEQANQLFGINV